MLRQRILDEITKAPRTASELALLLAHPRAVVRNELSQMCFADRSVTCDAQGRYSIGAPPEDWPASKRVHA